MKTLVAAALLVFTAGPALAQGSLQLRVTPERLQLRPGERAAVVVTASMSDGGSVPAYALTWSSTDSTVVKAEADAETPDVGRLVAGRAGTAVVTVRAGAARGFVSIRVEGDAPQIQPPIPPPVVVQPPPPPPSGGGRVTPTRPDAPSAVDQSRTTPLATPEVPTAAAVVLLTMWAGPEKFDGTGFVITPSGYLVTTRSAIARQGYKADSITVRTTERRGTLRADVLNVGPVGIDLAVLRIRDFNGSFNGRIDWNAGARQGEPITIIGFPGGSARGIARDGMARATTTRGRFGPASDERVQYDASTALGSGGSPLFNSTGNVVGVHRARLSDGSWGLGVRIQDLLKVMPAGLKAELGLN